MGDLETSEAIDLAVSVAQTARVHKPSSGAAIPKHKITPLVLEGLRLAYVGNHREVSANLTRLSSRHEIPKYRLTREARRQGWQLETRRPWTAEEDTFLLAGDGKTSHAKMAKLGRSWESMDARARELQRRSQAGKHASAYDIEEIARLFGVGLPSVHKWIASGLFGRSKSADNATSIPTSRVARFVRTHPAEYRLDRVNQSWFKAFVFGSVTGETSPEREETCL